MDSRSSRAVHLPRSGAEARRWRSNRVGCNPARWTARAFPIVSKGCFSYSCLPAFQSRDFGQTTPVTLGAAELCLEKGFDQLPSERIRDHMASLADHVHVVVLDPLVR